VQSPTDAEAARAAAQTVVEVHRALTDFLRVGQTLGQIDTFVGDTIEKLGSASCFYRYSPGRMPPFPSQACLSVNECIVHGTAGYLTRPMQSGDILSIDIGVKHRGWIGDAAWTYAFGEPSAEARRLMDCGKESLRRGIEQLHPDNTYLEWAREVHACVEGEHGFHLVRGLGGHGIGRKLHDAPWISNIPLPWAEWPDGRSECRVGTIVAVEPMLAVGTGETKQAPKQWPIFTADDSLAVHYEHDVLITEDGPEVLSEGLDDLPDVIDR